jgi:cytochrome c-type biogenesis protein
VPGEITLPLAFAAGLATFLSPCVLPLVPVYLASISGQDIVGLLFLVFGCPR